VGPTSYGSPIITSFDGVGSANAFTAGNQTVTIFGSNFGPLGTAVTATYTTNKVLTTPLVPLSDLIDTVVSNDTISFPAVECTVVEAHRKINCTTTEGAGFGIVWLLTIGNQTSQSPTTSFAAPTVTSVRVAYLWVGGSRLQSTDPVTDLSRLSTEGGDVLLVNGTNLGPGDPRPLVDAVWYGSGGIRYNLASCAVLVPHTQLRCLSSPGVGSGHRLSISVMYQASSMSSDVLAYREPTLTAVFPAVVGTSGGVVTLNGTDFGPSGSAISVLCNGEPLPTSVTLVVPHQSLRISLIDAVDVSAFALQVRTELLVNLYSCPTKSIRFHVVQLAHACRWLCGSLVITDPPLSSWPGGCCRPHLHPPVSCSRAA
jgi:hypothetical protein